MTPLPPAYARALLQAAGLADVADGPELPATTTAEPRPRSRYEQVGEDGGADGITFGETDVETPAVGARNALADLAPPPATPVGAVSPAPLHRGPTEETKTPIPDASPATDGLRPPAGPVHQPVAPHGSPIIEPATGPPPEIPVPAPSLVVAGRAVPSPDQGDVTRLPMEDADPVPRVPSVAERRPDHADDEPRPDARPRPPADADAAPSGGIQTVRAVPLPADPFPGPQVQQPEATGAAAPIVVEIGRVEVRLVADPSPPPRRAPHIRTGPSLEEYLGAGEGSRGWRS
jgi:hypothetical protein